LWTRWLSGSRRRPIKTVPKSLPQIQDFGSRHDPTIGFSPGTRQPLTQM
jgi:hypothetical protein